MSERSNKPLTVLPGPVPMAPVKMTHPERRRSVRYPFTAEANVVDLNSQTRLTGRSSDLGSGGCYIDTLGPFPEGTAVRVRIEREMRKFEAVATVTYTHRSMGMGLAFTDIKPEHQSLLNRWLSELGGEPVPESDETPAEPGTLSPVLKLQQILNDLINLMIRKKALTEDEGTALLRQIFR
jgi:hypothetical protein